jgi:hypothetical protein
MQLCTLSFQASATSTQLVLGVKLDGVEVWHGALSNGPQEIMHEFNDEVDCPRLLEISMQGKLPEHTTITPDGTIVKDFVVTIDNLQLDGIPLGHVFFNLAQYHHDFNGSQAPVIDRFYGTMGCNGVVKFEFSSPSYLWLLEHI